MTIQTQAPTSQSQPTDSAGPNAKSKAFDIEGVISSSTSEVALSELSKKGFKQVKVLNQAVITRLITAAVDQVITARSKNINRDERNKVIEESKAQFEAMARERLKRERARIAELERVNQALLKDADDLRKQLQDSARNLEETRQALGQGQGELTSLRQQVGERDQELGQLRNELGDCQRQLEQLHASGGDAGHTQEILNTILARLQPASSGPGLETAQLEKSIQMMAEKLDRLPIGGGGGGGGMAYVDKEVLIESLFRDDAFKTETNISQVKVKKEKAGGVKDSLAKLKALQKGGLDGDQ